METKSTPKDFNWNQIKNGVSRGQRHSALIWLIDYLMRYKYSGGYDLLTLILHWNRLNRPPLDPADIIITYREMRKNYPIPILSMSEPIIEKEEVPIPITAGAWLAEVKLGLAVWKKVMRKDRHHKVSPLYNEKGFRTSTTNMIMETWLPTYRQKEVAISLGAKSCGRAEWELPEAVNANQWERQFVKKIHDCEKIVDVKISKLGASDRSTAWQEIHLLDENSDLFDGYCDDVRL